MVEQRTVGATAAEILAIVGGILVVFSGFETQGAASSCPQVRRAQDLSDAGGIPGLTVELAVGFVAFLIALGGSTVIIRGLSVIFRRLPVSRFLIMLRGGAGFL